MSVRHSRAGSMCPDPSRSHIPATQPSGSRMFQIHDWGRDNHPTTNAPPHVDQKSGLRANLPATIVFLPIAMIRHMND